MISNDESVPPCEYVVDLGVSGELGRPRAPLAMVDERERGGDPMASSSNDDEKLWSFSGVTWITIEPCEVSPAPSSPSWSSLLDALCT